MSRIGRQPVIIPEGVQVTSEERFLKVSRDGAALAVPCLPGVSYALEDGAMKFSITKDDAQTRRNWGTMRSLFANAVRGVTSGYEKVLLLEGVGYRMSLSAEGGSSSGGQVLTMSLGFSHPVVYTAPEGITFEVNGGTLSIKGTDKQLVGEVAAEVRKFRPVEPYKGKGFRYADEVVRRKAGKKAAGGAA